MRRHADRCITCAAVNNLYVGGQGLTLCFPARRQDSAAARARESSYHEGCEQAASAGRAAKESRAPSRMGALVPHLAAAPSAALAEEVTPAPQPWDVFERFAHLPHALFLDSALSHAGLGRYSFLTADPFEW